MPVLRLASTVFMSCLVFLSANAAAWERGSVQSFASLPPGSPNPEGITADSRGNIYVSGFGPTTPQGATGPGYVFVFGQNGKLLRTLRPASRATRFSASRSTRTATSWWWISARARCCASTRATAMRRYS